MGAGHQHQAIEADAQHASLGQLQHQHHQGVGVASRPGGVGGEAETATPAKRSRTTKLDTNTTKSKKSNLPDKKAAVEGGEEVPCSLDPPFQSSSTHSPPPPPASPRQRFTQNQ